MIKSKYFFQKNIQTNLSIRSDPFTEHRYAVQVPLFLHDSCTNCPLKPNVPSYLSLRIIKLYSLAVYFQKMALGSVSSPVADKFRADLPRKMIESPWNSNETYEEGELVSID